MAIAKGPGKLAMIPAWISHPGLEGLFDRDGPCGLVLIIALQEFSRTHNPAYAWRAYQQARHAGLEIPSWVLDYLDGEAQQQWIRATRKESLRLPREAADMFLAGEVDYHVRQGEKVDNAVAEVARRHGVSKATVYRARR
jgi:hypothetical protein